MAISQEEWNALPEKIRHEITAYAHGMTQAQQRATKWEQWAGQPQNKEILDRWDEVTSKIRKVEEQEELTYEETQRLLKQTQRETREHRTYIQAISDGFAQQRRELEGVRANQREVIALGARLAKWTAEDPAHHDPNELLRIAGEKGINTFDDAAKLYDEERAKKGQSAAADNHAGVRYVRPGNETREHRLGREVMVSDAMAAALHAGEAAAGFDSPIQSIWTRRTRRPANPVPELNDK